MQSQNFFHSPGLVVDGHAVASQQFLELLNAHARVAHNRAHRVGVHRIVAGHDDANLAFGHEDVLALAVNPETRFFQRLHSTKVIDARKLGHITRWSLPTRGFRNAVPGRHKVRRSLEWRRGCFPMPPPLSPLGNGNPATRGN